MTNRSPVGMLLPIATTVIERFGLRRSRAGRRLIAGLNVLGERGARLLYLRGKAPVVVDGHKMFLAARRGPSLAFVSSVVRNEYETDTKALFGQLIREGMTVFDVGAHVGHYTLMAARLVGPHGRVYAFEPEPDNFSLLTMNVRLNGYSNITCIPKAVSDHTGTLTFHVNRQGNDRHSIVEDPNFPGMTSRCEIPAVTLDDFTASLGWPTIDVIKMDIEGAEPLAIAGMSELLRRSAAVSLLVEFAPEILRLGGTDPAEFLNTLGSLGFSVEPVESGVPLSLREIEKRGAINLLCKREPVALRLG